MVDYIQNRLTGVLMSGSMKCICFRLDDDIIVNVIIGDFSIENNVWSINMLIFLLMA